MLPLQGYLDKAARFLNNGRRNVAGLLAQAAVAFELGDHAGALASYRKALRSFPGCPPEVRATSRPDPATTSLRDNQYESHPMSSIKNVAGRNEKLLTSNTFCCRVADRPRTQNPPKSLPRLPRQVRLGIGACQFQLGNFAAARLAFSRVLQLSPGSTAALVGLAVLAMNEPTLSPAHITEALQLLCQVRSPCLLATVSGRGVHRDTFCSPAYHVRKRLRGRSGTPFTAVCACMLYEKALGCVHHAQLQAC